MRSRSDSMVLAGLLVGFMSGYIFGFLVGALTTEVTNRLNTIWILLGLLVLMVITTKIIIPLGYPIFNVIISFTVEKIKQAVEAVEDNPND